VNLQAWAEGVAEKLQEHPRRWFAASLGMWLVVLVLVVAVVAARCGGPTRETTTHAATTDTQGVKALLAQLEEERAKNVHQEVTETEVTRPDGTKTKTKHTTRDEAARSDIHATSSATEATATHAATTDTHTVERERARHRLAFLPGWRPSRLELTPAELTGEYTQRVAGPLSAGAWVRVERVPKLGVAGGLAVAFEW